ncbi:hypothetical protein CPAST_c22330 [Clostridium pasteurianum DSM 525 = ATCC 6013]|uniref:Uncharacterized protein n=1 Tax=Clostridium pasteurianum DSM 525 = ATCC 6013 TaxID=1262449 RepID=A0A0H3J8M6_CLOPA|nr:hypothetical protein [Clostridium pasteurianum]AJA48303.1 hypothetical protein CPAST_c22330 [Clostridium pasteurianum DSM 525 = ATCC 6013]AJA52291.1 hypothetical protein CLPA_c22330 [Clostridium pasteurianum DSM 525 = ATCC 6013]AOZ75555.1 hypothetical protein AQ983_10845 [Clostridium pasteurianum DSM 525 = ATCC 6013]AOZ79350.1 hypothetical protein AQ984_10835 [Clostridium pasteurianum]ELP60547.1 hypothetical protein F502_03642 [Clostridium pasteurianum DSM 525 = ATCC 6013]
MDNKRKIAIGILILLVTFTASYCYGYRSVLKTDIAYLYKKYLKTGETDSNVQTINVYNSEKNPAANDTIIKEDLPVMYVDRKYNNLNGKNEFSEDILKTSNTTSEDMAGKKVKDVYNSFKEKGFIIETKDNEILCVKVHSPGKFVPKLNGNSFEIYVANDKGELELQEVGGNINHKGEDEVIFNKDSQEYDTIEEARDSLSDFTS